MNVIVNSSNMIDSLLMEKSEDLRPPNDIAALLNVLLSKKPNVVFQYSFVQFHFVIAP